MLGPLMTFALVTSITPGPNNIMLTASGANFGFRRTIPRMLGNAIGFTVMVLAIGLGLSEIFETFPIVHQLLHYGGAAYLLYLPYRIATATLTTADTARGQTAADVHASHTVDLAQVLIAMMIAEEPMSLERSVHTSARDSSAGDLVSAVVQRVS